jgi:predicted glycoside hydrolase/deacetylase ChbG (UPF0249 family)
LLTQASLMLGEPAADEALRIARRNPRLIIGLHLTLCNDLAGKFLQNPLLANLAYLLDPRYGEMLQREIESQFSLFQELDLGCWYFDGHTHVHVNPPVYRRILPVAVRHGFRALRLVREWGDFSPKPAVLRLLGERARPAAERAGLRFTDGVYGVSCTGRVGTGVIRKMLRSLPAGLHEFYFHPGAEPGEIEAPPLLEAINKNGITLTSWRGLSYSPDRKRTLPDPPP